MSYFAFHLIFGLPLLAVLGWMARGRISRTHLRWMGVVAAIVVAFTFPWDSSAVSRRIWEFDDARVALRIGVLPVEEILFFLIETVAVCLLAVRFLPEEKRG